MNNLITAQEAFNAMLAGKQVLCRSTHLNSEFDSIRKFHADVFVQPGYEFCIKVELIELAGIQFTKPLTPHDVEDEQEIFIVMPMRVLRTKFDAENSEILCSVLNGFAQADAENATLQLKAIGATFGQVIGDVEIKDGFNDKPKKRRNSKPKGNEDKPEQQVDNAQTSTSNDVVNGPSPDQVKQAGIKDDEYQKNLATLLQRVTDSKTPAEVNAVYRYTRTWNEEQMEPLLKATHERLTELGKEKPTESEPPSLMAQIQTAPDLTTLDALEIDVAARDPQIQPRLMDFVKKRRFELENATATPAPEPDYLLEDYS